MCPRSTAARERCGQLGSPRRCLHERREVDVVGGSALLEVGAVARYELIADAEGGLRPVVERPLDVVAPVECHRDVRSVVRTCHRVLWRMFPVRQWVLRSRGSADVTRLHVAVRSLDVERTTCSTEAEIWICYKSPTRTYIENGGTFERLSQLGTDRPTRSRRRSVHVPSSRRSSVG